MAITKRKPAWWALDRSFPQRLSRRGQLTVFPLWDPLGQSYGEHQGRATLGSTSSYAVGSLGRYFDFDGNVNSGLSYGDVLDVTTEDMTLIVYLRLDAAGAEEGICGKKSRGDGNADVGYSMWSSSSRLGFDVSDDTNVAWARGTVVNEHVDGRFHLAVGVWRAAPRLAEIWVDGIFLDDGTTGTMGSLATAQQFRIGRLGSAGEDFDGGIAFVAMLRGVALLGSEIAALTKDPWRTITDLRRIPIILPASADELDQLRTRWRNDDDDEAAATWLAAENVPITRGKNLNTRLRNQLAATGDPDPEAFNLEYREKGSGDPWRKVTVIP